MVDISIIIPSYNQGKYLEQTFKSVINQQYPNLEIIVMDGGSIDNSVEIIKKYAPFLTYWQSQKDNGQSAAINDGFRRATGKFVTWLNSDDILMPNTLHYFNQLAQKYSNIRFFLGNVVWIDKSDKVLRAVKVERYSSYFAYRGFFSNGGPSAFINKDLLEEYGYLRDDFHYMMDTELWHRLISNGIPFIRIDRFCWGLRLHENAKMSGHNFKNSILANKMHPSWMQKVQERQYIQQKYPYSQSLYDKVLYTLYKIFDNSFISRFTNILNKGKFVYDINDFDFCNFRIGGRKFLFN